MAVLMRPTVMTEPSLPGFSADREQTEATGNGANGQADYTGSVVHRKVSVKGSGGVRATVVVTVQQGEVWASIMPPFTWEAIMGPGKVDELIRTLAQARDDAAAVRHARTARAEGQGHGRNRH